MSTLAVYAITPTGSVPLHGMAPVGKVAFSTVFGAAGGCGLDQLTFSMTLPRGFSNALLVQGTILELRYGPTALGRAALTTPDFETGAVTATGLFKRGADFIAFADLTTYAGTLNPKTGITNAITQGLEWQVDAATLAALDVTLATTGTSENVDATTWYTVSDLLDAYCGQQGANVFWGIDPTGFLRIYQTPTTPSFMLSPSVPAMDSTTTDYVTDLVCRYSDITKPTGDGSTFYDSAVLATVPVRVGSSRKFGNEDITSHGPLTAAQAQDIANQTLAAKSPTLTYNGGVDIVAGDVRTLAGGAPVPLWRVVAEAGLGVLVRHHGWRNMQGALMPGFAQEWVIGKASYADTGAVSLSPTADAAKTLGQTLSSTVKQVTEVGKQADQAGRGVVEVNTFAQQLSASLTQAQVDIDSKISRGATPPTDATPGTPWSIYYVESDDQTIVAQYVCTAGTGADSGNVWEQQKLDAVNLIVPGTIEAEHMVATLDFTAKNVNGGTFTGNFYRTGSTGRRMEVGHNVAGGIDPSNMAFYNGVSGESPAVIGPYNTGGGISGNPALAVIAPAQPNYPNAVQVDLVSGSTATTTGKSGTAGDEPKFSVFGNVYAAGDAEVAGNVIADLGLIVNRDVGVYGTAIFHGICNPQYVFSASSTNLNAFTAAAINATTSSGTAVQINASNNIVFKASSGRRHKVDVHRLADAITGGSILDIDPVRYRDRHEVAMHAANHEDWQPEPRWWIGWTADAFAEAGWEDLITRDPDTGEPDYLHYERVLPALALELRERFTALETENTDLRARLDALESRLTTLEGAS